jgi:type IV pilus assembly protein PilV
MNRSRTSRYRRPSRGFTLIEVMVALLVFAVGVLGLVRLQGGAVRFSSDAQQRADATFLADQLLSRMLISDPTTMASFAHHPTGTTKCAPTGDTSANAVVTAWLSEVSNLLPNASDDLQQIVVDTVNRQVTVRLCWQNGSDGTHQLVVSNVVQWQP